MHTQKFYVSDEALKAIQQFLDKRSCYVPIRVGVQKSFKYFIECAEEINQDDVTLQFGDIVLVLDDLSAHLLNGAVLHWRETEKGSGLKIHNPSEQVWRSFSQCFAWLV